MITAILHSLIGFYLQLVPCAFFCLYPFYNSFRYPRRRIIALVAAIVIGMSVIFTHIYVVLDIPSGAYVSFFPLNLTFLLTVGLLAIVYLLSIRAPAVHLLYMLILVLNYGFLVSDISDWFIADWFFNVDYLYDTGILLTIFIATVLLFYPMLKVLRLVRSAFDSLIEASIWKWFLLTPSLFFAAMLLFYQIPLSIGWPRERILSLFIRAMIVLMLIICVIALRTMQAVQRQADEYAAIKSTVNSYKLMAETTRKERELRHEFHHHIAALSILLQNQNYEGAKDYLDKISESDAGGIARTYTPHVLLNSILSEYERRAAASEIPTSYSIHVPNPVFMNDSDLCQFLSNMLDNAIEANLQLESGERNLSLTIRQTGNFLYFLCENPCDSTRLRPSSDSFDTIKSGDNSHGYGLPIMKRIAEKYNGVFRIDIQDAVFTVTANLCAAPHNAKGRA